MILLNDAKCLLPKAFLMFKIVSMKRDEQCLLNNVNVSSTYDNFVV